MSCNTPLWPLLSLTGGRIDPIRSFDWLWQALAPICFIPTRLLSLYLQQVPNPYPLGARRRWLKVNCVERIGIWPALRTWNWQRLGNLLSARVYWSCIPASTKANRFPPWYIPNTSWTPWWVMERRAKNVQHLWRLQIKKINETCENQTRRMRHQTLPDSLLLNLWRRYAKPNSYLSS